MTAAIDHQADALLLAVTEMSGGDIRVAFALLCSRVSLDDLMGETFDAALTRAVRGHFEWPEIGPAQHQDIAP
jgi:hypothetical protein